MKEAAVSREVIEFTPCSDAAENSLSENEQEARNTSHKLDISINHSFLVTSSQYVLPSAHLQRLQSESYGQGGGGVR